MESPPISPISCHSPPPFPQSYPRAPQSGALERPQSSSMESLSWRPSTYSRTSSDDSLYLPMENHRSSRRRRFSTRNSTDDSLHVPVNNSQTIKRWNGLTREAINWNALPRDPELFFPTGNCLVYLYPAGHSQRGPSFRIPYHIILYSGCRPLVQQCLVSQLNISSPDRVISNPLSRGSVDYSVSQDTRSYLYLYPPTGLSRDESYSYHITTRNFFAWLLGVPLVGTDPVSALLDLKARMDIWCDPKANNFEAVFEYARQQAYGDFEEIQIEMDKRTESKRAPERAPVQSFDQVQVPTRMRQHRHNSDMGRRSDSLSRRSDSLRRKLKSSISKASNSHIALQDKRVEHVPPHVEPRQSLPRLTTSPTMPAVPFNGAADGTTKRFSGPTRAQSSYAGSSIQARETAKINHHPSSSTSDSPVSPMTPVDSNGIDAALRRLTGPPSAESVTTVSSTQATKSTKKKNRVSWADNSPTVAEARSSQTDLTYPNMRGLGVQSAQASSSAINVGQAIPSARPMARRSLTSLPLSSHPVAGPSTQASMLAYSRVAPWGEEIRLARPMSTSSLISIPIMHPATTPGRFEPCSCCGKMRRSDTGSSQNHSQQSRPSSFAGPEPCSCCGKLLTADVDVRQTHHQWPRPSSAIKPCSCCGKTRRPETGSFRSQQKQPRPASAGSMKSFRSTKSWRSLRSIRSSFSIRSLRSSVSISSIRSYLSKRSTNKSFAEIKTNMKDRRAAFKARLGKKDKRPNLDVDNMGNQPGLENTTAPASCNPYEPIPPRPTTSYRCANLKEITTLGPAELEAEPVVMETVPELEPSNPWNPDSYSDSPNTRDASLDETRVPTRMIRPKEIYTSREYRHQPKPRRPVVDMSNLLHGLTDEGKPDVSVLDIGTPGGFEEDFVDTLISQLEAAGIAEKITSQSKGKARMEYGEDYEEEDLKQGVEAGGVWMGVRSNIGVPRLEVRAMA